jgi:hypothetical protein
MAEVATAADTGDRGPRVDSAVDALRRSILAIRGGPEVVAPVVVVALLAAVQWSPVRFLRYVSAPVGVYLVARRGPGSIETETGSTPVGLRVLVALLAAVVAALATSVGFVLLVLPGLYLLVRFYLVVPAVVLDDAGPLEALGRSWERTDGNVTTVAGVVVAVLAVGSIVSFPLLFLMTGSVVPTAVQVGTWEYVIVESAAATIGGPLGAAAMTVLYDGLEA